MADAGDRVMPLRKAFHIKKFFCKRCSEGFARRDRLDQHRRACRVALRNEVRVLVMDAIALMATVALVAPAH